MNLPHIQFPFATEDFGYDPLRANLRQLRLCQVMLGQQVVKHMNSRYPGHGVVTFFVGVHKRAERVEQPIQRMSVIVANVFEQTIEHFDCTVLSTLVANRQHWLECRPVWHELFR